MAVYDFDASDPQDDGAHQLPLQAGDRVTVEADAGEGWLFGRRGVQRGFFPASHVEMDDVDDSDRFTTLSAGSFTTVALSNVPSAVLKAGVIGASLRPLLGQTGLLGHPRGLPSKGEGAEGMSSGDGVEAAELVGPDDSISNAGQPSPHSSAPPQLSWVRLVACRHGAADEDWEAPNASGAAGGSGGGGIKVARPDSVATLLEHATRKATLLWPDRPGTVARALLDEDGCEVDEENFCLVQPGAVLYVAGVPETAQEQELSYGCIVSTPPSLPRDSAAPTSTIPSSLQEPLRVASTRYMHGT